MSLKHLLVALLFLGPVYAFPQATPPVAQPDKKPAAAAKPTPQHQGEGDRIFQQNCSRCHNAPEGFSSRISGTVLRHMRVRASLSQRDEQELLRFLNP
jgi:hypothetical protein